MKKLSKEITHIYSCARIEILNYVIYNIIDFIAMQYLFIKYILIFNQHN